MALRKRRKLDCANGNDVHSQNNNVVSKSGDGAAPEMRKIPTAHNWASYKHYNVWDDGTITFFWRAHTLTVLFLFSCVLLYVAVFDVSTDSNYNTKRGVIACICAFILFGITQTPDGPFKRPHPVLWRFVFCVTIIYLLALIFILFQTADDARLLMKHFDSELGKPLPERDYGGNCKIYDPGHPEGPFHLFWDKMDCFVPTHFFGWWLKTLVLRDYWLCMVISIMFEVLEYTLEHQLPNFSECWWDHWILDALVCNGAGIYFGMKTLNYLKMKPYHWRGMWNIPTYKGKLKRIVQQFSPYSWMEFDWRPTASLTRWILMLGVIFMFLLAEINTFYLKYVLWIPPPHYINIVRLGFFMLAGAVSMRETFQYLDDPECKQFGRQSWLVAAIIITELLVVIKFDWETVTKPLPTHMQVFWTCAISSLVGYTIWKFFIVNDHKDSVVLIHTDDEDDNSSIGSHAQGALNRELRTQGALNNEPHTKGALYKEGVACSTNSVSPSVT